MSTRPWIPFYTAEYLQDTAHLTTLEHGAYLLLIFYYWATGRIPKEPRRLAAVAKMTEEQWSSIATEVLSFFVEADGTYRHTRLDKDIAEVGEKRQKRIDAGSKGGQESKRRRSATSNAPSNATSKATPIATAMLHQSESESDSDSDKKEVSSLRSESPASPSKPKRATRLPADWTLSGDNRDYAVALGLPDKQIEHEAESFRDYWHSKPRDNTKLSWDATWRTWIRRTADRQPQRNLTPQSHGGSYGGRPQGGSVVEAADRLVEHFENLGPRPGAIDVTPRKAD